MILTIVGAGLIGTSFARALRDRFERVLAIEPDAGNARTAVAANDVDVVVTAVPANCDAILLACPSDRISNQVIR